jgi:hypothetical protein
LVKNALGTLALPAEFIISLLYWGIMAINPALMVPENSIMLLPLGLDLSIHSFPAVFLFMDFLFFSPPFSKQTNPFVLAAVAGLAYGVWLFVRRFGPSQTDH